MAISNARQTSATNKLSGLSNYSNLRITESKIGENVNRPVFHIETEFGHCNYEVFDECIFVGNLYTKSEYRRQGHVRDLLNLLQERFKTELYLDCFFTLKPFYEHLGFVEHDVLPDNYFEMVRTYDTYLTLSDK